MSEGQPLVKVLDDLIGILHLQTKELEKLVDHVEQVAGHLGYKNQFSIVASELSELHVRLKKLQTQP